MLAYIRMWGRTSLETQKGDAALDYIFESNFEGKSKGHFWVNRIQYTLQLLPDLNQQKKKDDLCDAFLYYQKFYK